MAISRFRHRGGRPVAGDAGGESAQTPARKAL